MMDRAATVATWVNIVLFGGLAILCLRVSQRERQAAWAAASFGVIGALSAVVLVLPEDGQRVSQPVVRQGNAPPTQSDEIDGWLASLGRIGIVNSACGTHVHIILPPAAVRADAQPARERAKAIT